jgi:hypothetical protein
MCASYKEFLTKYGPRPSINHTFTMKKGTRRYAWVLKLPPNPYAGIQKNSSDMYQATHNNKYIGVYATRELARSARAEYIDNLPKSKANIVDMRGVDNSMLHTPIAKGEEALSKEIEADIDEAFGDL